MMRTRIKFCGLTRADDIGEAVAAGADAVGFNCYAGSPRFVALDQIAELARVVPPLVTPVLLFVNAAEATIRRAIDLVPQALLQFHGDETPQQCARWNLPFVRALHVHDQFDLAQAQRDFAQARALLLDAPGPSYGGSGTVFDWSRLSAHGTEELPLILAGGLTASNVGGAIRALAPFAVDVSSGIEDAPGRKSAVKMREFAAAVRAVDVECFADRAAVARLAR